MGGAGFCGSPVLLGERAGSTGGKAVIAQLAALLHVPFSPEGYFFG